MARGPLTHDFLDELEMRRDVTDDEGEMRMCELYLDLKRDPHPDDVYGAGDLLICAAEAAENYGDRQLALQLLYEAMMEGDNRVQPDPRGEITALHLRMGERELAMEMANELRRADSPELDVYWQVGEAMEQAGEERQALAWYTRGILMAEQLGRQDDFEAEALYVVRLRLRDQMGMAPDEDDLWAQQILERRRG